MTTRLTLIHTLSPLHAGTGQAVGAIDLPIARERPTGIPLVPGSSIKGALRARVSDPQWRAQIFGPDTPNASEHAGAVHFADAHLLLLPVRSLWGTFAWVTSPFLLMRFARDLSESGAPFRTLDSLRKLTLDACLVSESTLLTHDGEGQVVLEDLDLKAKRDKGLSALLEHVAQALDLDLPERLCIVHDDVMSTLMESATEVRARIRLNEDSKTVDKGALWYEESLPAESVLFGLVLASDVPARRSGAPARRAEALVEHLNETTAGTFVQLGGKASTGRGLCRLSITGGSR